MKLNATEEGMLDELALKFYIKATSKYEKFETSEIAESAYKEAVLFLYGRRKFYEKERKNLGI